MKKAKTGILIGRVADRTGVSVSALRFYEEAGLIQAGRNQGVKECLPHRISDVFPLSSLRKSLAFP